MDASATAKSCVHLHTDTCAYVYANCDTYALACSHIYTHA